MCLVPSRRNETTDSKRKKERETERKGVVLVVESRRTAALSRWRLLLARSGKSFRGTFKGSLNFRPTFDDDDCDGGGSTWPERLILSFYTTPSLLHIPFLFSFFLSFSFSSTGSPGVFGCEHRGRCESGYRDNIGSLSTLRERARATGAPRRRL